MTILLVEDDNNDYLLAKSLLGYAGIDHLRAENGNSAIEICKMVDTIKMVFMDLRMPGIDGYETTKRIKAFRQDLPIVTLTAYALSDEKHVSLSKGCDDYMSKPYSGDEFFKMIEKWTGFKTNISIKSNDTDI